MKNRLFQGTRRTFLAAVASLGAANVADACWRRRGRHYYCPPCPPCPKPPFPPDNPPSTLKIRKDIRDLDSRQLASLARGVEVMKSRPESDPTSWQFQANMHGSGSSAPHPLWDQCRHGTEHFLTWHRGYIYFFERILRTASGDPSLSLPYWNWSEQLQLPDAFRVSTSPLFDSSRALNNGGSLQPTTTVDSLRIALSNATFYAPFDASFSSLHEGSPHGAVHVDVGGNMTAFETAARDPIFWLHHANVDRIWDIWLNMAGGRANWDDAAFLDEQFTFIDENGADQTVAVRDILDSRTLQYRYDDVPNPPSSPTMQSLASAPGAAIPHSGHAAMAEEKEAVIVAAPAAFQAAPLQDPSGEPAAERLAAPKALGLNPERIELAPLAQSAAALRHAAAEAAPGQLFVEVQGIQLQRAPELTYGVYLNLPEEISDPQQARPYYLGNLHLFGKGAEAQAAHAAMDGAGHHGAQALNDFNQSFDASPVIERLRRENKWQEDSFSVTLLPLPPIAPPNLREAAMARAAASIEQSQISYRSAVLKARP